MYLLSNGYFALDRYEQTSANSDSKYLWAMFILAVFLNMIVFMNMLIAIMADTFAKVMRFEEESGLQEIVSLINDNLWVLDFE